MSSSVKGSGVVTALVGGALFSKGFRPFFLAAAVFAPLAMAVWALVYAGRLEFEFVRLSASQWHAHEMLFGYAIAVVAGFLLTAVSNWTGSETARGVHLLLLVLLWSGARVCLLFGERWIGAACAFDMAFALALAAAVGLPLLRARQWRQAGVLAKLALLGIANAAFYLGAFGILDTAVTWSLYGGLFLLVSLVLTIGARVLPGFIERGIAHPITIVTPRWMTPLNLVLFVSFFVVEVFIGNNKLAGGLAVALFAVNSARLIVWHTPGLWHKPLLWGLYLAFVLIDLGFALFALGAFGLVNKLLAVHTFAIGGIALATLSMMARVALGHSGRDVLKPPPAVALVLALMVAAVVARIVWPLFSVEHYALSVQTSQALWIAAFVVFAYVYTPILVAPRVDGRPG